MAVLARAAAAALACLVLAALPAGATGLLPPPLAVTGACLLDEQSGQILYTFNAEGRLAIASATKLMTALVVLEHAGDLDVRFAQNAYVSAAGDSQIGLVPGERMSVRDLLLAMMLPSADDAAEDLAFHVGGGSVAGFVAMMNARARQLGLTHTHYSTPIGLDTAGNYSSPCDLVELARYDLQHWPVLRRIVSLRAATLSTGRYVRHVVNRNTLVGRVPWINGVKTGHTAAAGYVLVASGTRDGMTLIGSALGTTSEAARDANALALLGYGFAGFRRFEPLLAGAVVARVPVRDRPGLRAAVIAGGGYARVLPRATLITRRLELPRELVGPLPRHQDVGRLTLLADGRVLTHVPLLLAHRLAAVSPLAIAARFLTRTSTLLVIVAAAGLAVGVTMVRREVGRTPGSETGQSA